MKNLSNAGGARNPRKTTTSEQKMGLPPAHAKTMSEILNPESRRRLSRIFCGRGVQGRKNVGPFPRLLTWAIVTIISFSCAVALGTSLEAPEFLLEFDNQQGQLVRLFDKSAGHEHIAPDVAGDLWVVELPENAGGVLRPSDAKTFAVQASEPAHVLLSWSAFGRESMPNLSVEISVSYDAEQYAGCWDIVIRGLEKTVPAVVRFPRIPHIAKQESEALAVPFWMGEKTKRAREYLSPAEGPARRSEFPYPGLLSLQCMAFYREGGPGLYIAADDIKAHSKSFAVFGDGKEGLGLEVCHFPGADVLVESTYTPGYNVMVGVFQGDWITAAERYRNWALKQPWAQASRLKQGSTPDWVMNTGFWVWNRGVSEGVLPPAAVMQAYLGVPVSVFWHWWHGCAYDVGFPEYLPPREGTAAFRKAVRTARNQGLNTIV
ncbi:MAG TPA: DUF6259 domain-containing protein, partial [Candidatus Hydrogenedentes bacterium]|nr:DUF6259 domain-containing protein [Candidatus Hydrogenedentota bacterium]